MLEFLKSQNIDKNQVTILELNKKLDDTFKKSLSKKNKFLGFSYSKDIDYSKAYKIIAALISDHYSVKKVYSGKSWILLEVKSRKKQKFKFPLEDHHFDKTKDRYQYHTLLLALSFIKEHRIAIDIGGHIGLYSSALSDSFKSVVAFEPSTINAKCFKENVPGAVLHECALGERVGTVELNIAPDNTGNNSIIEEFGGKKIKVDLKTLDSFNFSKIDLIKIDVQGYEEQVLLGAKETLERNKPIIIIELITHKDSPPNEKALEILKSYGYKVLATLGKDYIMGV